MEDAIEIAMNKTFKNMIIHQRKVLPVTVPYEFFDIPERSFS